MSCGFPPRSCPKHRETRLDSVAATAAHNQILRLPAVLEEPISPFDTGLSHEDEIVDGSVRYCSAFPLKKVCNCTGCQSSLSRPGMRWTDIQ